MSIKILKIGSLCRVTLPNFKEKLAVGRVCDVQIIYTENEAPYLMVWVQMLIDNVKRPFEAENLELIPRHKFSNEHEFYRLSETLEAVA